MDTGFRRYDKKGVAKVAQYCRSRSGLIMRLGMRQHRVAILGGAGFIGRYVVKRLAERGDVLTVGGRTASAAKYLKLKGDVGQVGLVNLSIADETLLPAFVANNNAVVNLVGILHESGSQRFDLLHHVMPARLARLAREAGVERFVHVSA